MKTSPSGPWGISVRTPKKTIMRVVPQGEGETLKGCLNRAKATIQTLRDKYSDRDDMVIELISRRKAFEMPTKVKLKPGQLWCPYCIKPRRFKKNQVVEIDGISYVSDYSRCTICGISDNDYYVKHYNHLWPDIKNIRSK